MMNKFVKIAGIVAAVIVIFAIVLVVLAKVLITPERVRETVLPLAEKSLQRKIDLGEIKVSLFSGIELHDLKVYERNAEDLFVGTNLVRLRYQLLPLLGMRVVIDEVRVEQPRIRVVRLADGRFNFSDIAGGAEARKDQEKAGADTQAVAADKSAPPISLLVSQVRLQGGELLFLDHVLNDKAPYRFDVKNLEVAADGITLTGSVPVKASCRLNGGTLDLDGEVDLNRLGGVFDVNLLGIDVLAFKPYFEEQFPGRLGSAKLDLETRVSGSADEVKASGELILSELDFTLEALPEAPFEGARVAVGHDFTVNLPEERLQLRRLAADLNGIQVDMQGSVNKLLSQPVTDLELTVPGLELRTAMTSVPTALVKDVKDHDPAGTVRMTAKLTGGVDDPTKLVKHATIDLDKVQVTAGGHRPSLSGRLALEADRLHSKDLQLRIGDNRADITLAAENLFGQPIVATADLSSQRFLLDPLLKGGGATVATQEADESPQATDSQTRKSAGPEELGPFDIPVQSSGTVRIGEALYKGLSIKDFVALYQLKDNVLTISKMDGKVAGGTFSNRARLDLAQKGLAYSAAIDLQSIQADPLLSAFLPKAAGALFGATNLSLSLNGRGTQWETLSKRLGGQGDLLIADGRLTSPGLVQGFASFLQLSDMKEIRFRNFKGAFKIVDGKLRVDSQILSDQLKLMPKGAIGLNGSLDLSLDTRLSPEVAARLDQQGKVTGYLQDQQGWSQLPLQVTGTVGKPRFGLDPDAVKAQATRALTDKLEGQIDKLFKKDQKEGSQEAESQPVEEDPAQKMLKDSLQKLFGN